MATSHSAPRRALITGASGGLGAALARRLAARGIEVWLAARREEQLRAEVARIERDGGHAHALLLDIAQSDATHARLVQLDEETGGIDLVIANAALAGLAAARPVSRTTYPEVRDLLQTNLLGSVATLMAFVPGMLARGHGHLVAISSVAADATNPRTAAYGASKAALSYFLEAAGIELSARGVVTTVVHPGFMRTPAADGVKEPMPFIVEADDAAAIIDRAIRRRARFVRFPRSIALMNQATNLIPTAVREPLLRYLTRER